MQAQPTQLCADTTRPEHRSSQTTVLSTRRHRRAASLHALRRALCRSLRQLGVGPRIPGSVRPILLHRGDRQRPGRGAQASNGPAGDVREAAGKHSSIASIVAEAAERPPDLGNLTSPHFHCCLLVLRLLALCLLALCLLALCLLALCLLVLCLLVLISREIYFNQKVQPRKRRLAPGLPLHPLQPMLPKLCRLTLCIRLRARVALEDVFQRLSLSVGLRRGHLEIPVPPLLDHHVSGVDLVLI
mmetsp:Transcript_19615/g.43645  ORF Transcript_19615/g.43645 Transcript_19615/m.43645 type:complete len:244 (+) Transcript_19615:155-886(+)